VQFGRAAADSAVRAAHFGPQTKRGTGLSAAGRPAARASR